MPDNTFEDDFETWMLDDTRSYCPLLYVDVAGVDCKGGAVAEFVGIDPNSRAVDEEKSISPLDE